MNATAYRLYQSVTINGRSSPIYVADYSEAGDSIHFIWTSDPKRASRLGRSAAVRAAEKIEADFLAYRETRSEEYRSNHPATPITIRPVTGGEPIER